MKEHQQLERKAVWRDEFLRGICGFANASGGILQIGKNDKGEIVGLPNAAKLLEDLPNKIRDVLGILVEVDLRQESGGEFLEITVEPYPNPISYRGHYFMRSGSTMQELKGAALDRFLLGRQGRTWDGVPMPGVKTDDLSAAAVRRFRDLAATSGRLEAADLAASDADLIEKLKLTEGVYLKRAAVLLFHEDPEKFVTGAFVKIGFFRSETDLAYHDTLHGNLFSQVANTIDLVRTKYLKAAITYQGIQRIECYPVPNAALREAILNALVHRDYAMPSPVQIRVYEDKLKIWNPIVMPEGWTLETLLGEHSSAPYNPTIANAFFRSGEIEAWGRGIQRIFEACHSAGTPEPQLRITGHDLWLEFPFSSEYLKAISAPEVTPQVTPEVTPEVEKLLNVVSSEQSRRDLQDALGLRDDDHMRISYILPALAAGLLEMTLPDKPNSRLQKYRLTAKGRAWLSQNQP